MLLGQQVEPGQHCNVLAQAVLQQGAAAFVVHQAATRQCITRSATSAEKAIKLCLPGKSCLGQRCSAHELPCSPGSRPGPQKSRLTSPSQMMAFICTRSITPAKVSSDPMGSCREHHSSSGQVLAVERQQLVCQCSSQAVQRPHPWPLAWRLPSCSTPYFKHHTLCL